MHNTTERLTALDSLRGIAILMVMSIHASEFIAPSSEWLKTVVSLGSRGVQLFYVVSAFSLFLSYAQRKTTEPFSYRAYFIRRLTRIAPMFWLAIALNLAISGLAPRYWAPGGITWTDVVLTATFLNGLKPDAITSVVPGGWSIAVETSFYLLLPIFFVFVKSLRSALAAAVICLFIGTAVSAWYFQANQASYPNESRYLLYSFAWLFWLPAQLPVFGFGLVLYYLRKALPSTAALGYCWLACAVLLLIASTYLPADGLMRNYIIASAGFLFLSLAVMDAKLPPLDNRVLRLIGKVSFSIYLLHIFVLNNTAFITSWILKRVGMAEHGDIAYALALAVLVFFSTLLSMVTYRCVEAPFIRLGGKFSKKFARESKPMSSERHNPQQSL